MDVMGHDLNVVPMDVVIEAAGDRLDVIIGDLAGIECFVLGHKLELFRDNEIAALDVVAIRGESVKASRHSVNHPPTEVFAQIFADQIERTDMMGTVETPSLSLRCGRGGESRERPVS